MNYVVLVDEHDNETGVMEKFEAHTTGALHRAFSVLLFNSRRELLLQRRSCEKYHSGGLWSNTCCSHPLPGEPIEDAARRCLLHEMGIHSEPSFAYKFIYRANLDHGLQEHELDYVFTGRYDGIPSANATEVADWKFIAIPALREDMHQRPEKYSYWFRLMMGNPTMNSILGDLPVG